MDALTAIPLPTDGLAELPSGVYAIPSNWEPAEADVSFTAGNVTFTGGKPDFSNWIPYQGGPIWSQHLVRKTYGTDWTGYGNIFHQAAYVTSDIPSAHLGGANVVSVFGGADARGDNSSVWGSNFVGYATNATGTAIASEINFGALVDGGTAYGIVLAATGSYGSPAAVQIQANSAGARPTKAIKFNNRAHGLALDALIGIGGDTTVAPSQVAIDFSGYSFPGGELKLTSFEVEPTLSNTVNRIGIRGAATLGRPRIRATGTDTDIGIDILAKGAAPVLFTANGSEQFRIGFGTGADNLQAASSTGAAVLSARGTSANIDAVIVGKGTGGVRIQDGAGANKVRVNTTGIGFNGTAPVAKPTVAGSRDGNAALASLLTALANMGLITDSTTA